MDFRRVFSVYLEAPISIFVKDRTIQHFIFSFLIFLYKLPIYHRWSTVWPLLATSVTVTATKPWQCGRAVSHGNCVRCRCFGICTELHGSICKPQLINTPTKFNILNPNPNTTQNHQKHTLKKKKKTLKICLLYTSPSPRD